MILALQLSFLPLSTNAAYKTTRYSSKIYLSPEAKALKQEIKTVVEASLESLPSPVDLSGPLSVHLQFYANWLTKKGTIKRKDVANLEKLAMDALSDALGFDDCQVFHLQLEKIQSDTEKTLVTISSY